MRIFGGISDEEIKLSIILMMFFLLITICKESESHENCKDIDEYEDNNLSEDELNGDEDDERNFNDFSEITKIYTTMLSIGKKEQPKCNEDRIMYYLAELQVINPETILQIASYNDLERSCRKISSNLKSIDNFMVTCTPLPQSHLYMQLITGVRVLYSKLCVQSDYQLAFKGYMECFQELHNEYIDCGGPADWTENMGDSELCMEYKAISDCYYTQTALLCGIKAAKIMKELVVRVINAVIETRCPEVRKNPLVEDPMPEHAIYTRESKTCKISPCTKLQVSSFLLITYCIY